MRMNARPPTPRLAAHSPASLDTALPGCAASCVGVHRFGCGRAGAAPTPLFAWLFLLSPAAPAGSAGPAPHPARVVLAAPASGQRGTGWGCSGAARRARPQPEVERARAAVELVLMG
ncbi:hypothetical protein DFH09DRAFT_1101394 [Mycena vulgaris]|nr:hypothetical protein DFH09DRAFT_1101394 [Mycena vulgaris]